MALVSFHVVSLAVIVGTRSLLTFQAAFGCMLVGLVLAAETINEHAALNWQ